MRFRGCWSCSRTRAKQTILFTLAAFTGLRRGELLRLEWNNIDWEHDLLKVVRTSEYIKEKGIYTDTSKTESSMRVIKLPPEVMQKLKESLNGSICKIKDKQRTDRCLG